MRRTVIAFEMFDKLRILIETHPALKWPTAIVRDADRTIQYLHVLGVSRYDVQT